jgi:hypothetical protein
MNIIRHYLETKPWSDNGENWVTGEVLVPVQYPLTPRWDSPDREYFKANKNEGEKAIDDLMARIELIRTIEARLRAANGGRIERYTELARIALEHTPEVTNAGKDAAPVLVSLSRC